MWSYFGYLLTFLVFVGVLYYLLYKPVGRILRERKEKQDEALRKAEQLRAEAEEIRGAAAKAQETLDAKREGILDETREQAEAERKELLKTAEDQARARIERFRRLMTQEREELLGELRGELRETILSVAHAMIGGDHAVFVERALRKVEDLLKDVSDGDVKAVRRALSEEGQPVSVTTASPLEDKDEDRLRDMFAERFDMDDDEIRLKVSEDASLAAGFEIVVGPLSLSANWRDAIDEALKAKETES